MSTSRKRLSPNLVPPQQFTDWPPPLYEHVFTVLPPSFFRKALSPSLFQMYQLDPQYRSFRSPLPLPVWIATELPAPSLKVPKVYLWFAGPSGSNSSG